MKCIRHLYPLKTHQESNIEEADALEEDNEEKQDNVPEEGDEEVQ